MTLSQELRIKILRENESGKQYRDISRDLGVSLGSIVNVVKKGNRALVKSSPSRIEPDYDEQDIDFDNQPYETQVDALLEETDYNPALDGASGERLLDYIIEPEQDDGYPKENGPSFTAPSENLSTEPKPAIPPKATISTTFASNNIVGPRSSNLGDRLVYNDFPVKPAVNNNSHHKVINAPPIIEEKVIRLIEEPEIDFDFSNISYPDFYPAAEELTIIKAERDTLQAEKMEVEEGYQELDADKRAFEEETEATMDRMKQKVSSEKYLIKHEYLVLGQKQKQLEERMYKVEQKEQGLFLKERNLVIRECKIMEAEPLLSLARQFQNMGLDFDSLLPWIEYLREQAARGIDSKTAATYMVYEIKSHGELEGFRKQLDIAQAQLEKINTLSAQKQRDLSILAELQKENIQLDVIYTLSKIVDLPKIAAELKIRTDPWSNVNNGNNGYPGNGMNNGHLTNQNLINQQHGAAENQPGAAVSRQPPPPPPANRQPEATEIRQPGTIENKVM